MNQILYLLVLFPAIFFVVTGLRWLVDPAVVAPEFGLVLAEGPGVGLRVRLRVHVSHFPFDLF